MASQLSLETFDSEGDPISVGMRWERWKRALYIYLEAANITQSQKKRANLLHFGGFGLQEIFSNIPGANVEPEGDIDVFTVAIGKLDEYFAPKQSKIYERHVFRLMKQEQDEKFDKFLVRLRQQANKCQFKDKEDNIIDQITEKCSSKDLRKKILKMGDDMDLDKIVKEANTLEIVTKQLDEFGTNNKNEGVNKIFTRDLKPKPKFVRRFERREISCGRCGNRSHISKDLNCPARDKKCLQCGLQGHFRQYCRTKNTVKRKLEENKNTQKDNAKRFKSEPVNNVDDKIETSKEKYYVFNIDDDDDDDELPCTVGGVVINMLVDSGCKRNLITEESWKTMKQNNVQVNNPMSNPATELTAYGSDKPLQIKGSFEATIKVGNEAENATFFVICNGTRNLLGKKTATSLGVLKVGLDANVNNVEGTSNGVFPKFKDILVELPIDDSVPPVNQPYRRIPIPLEEKIDIKIQDLINRDIIEEVMGSSRWVSPMVPILKEDGEVRLCVDMRRANEAIVRENHPLPTMEVLLPKIREAKIFTKLDIKDAFHQIEIDPKSRHITTFITGKGLFRYKRLLFGISCAPEIFQKTLERILLGCDGVVNFIDDILVFGKDMAEHNERLGKVIKVLEANNVVLREDKCVFRVEKVNFLGHELSGKGVRPLQKYVETIQEFRPPTKVSELRSFLGLVNFVSKWIPDFVTRTEPLRQLLRNRKHDETDIQEAWGAAQQQGFDSLKSVLTNIPTLGYYNVKDRTMVIADASPVGLGGVLVQVNNEGPRIIAYGHKTLTDCERKYCQTEKEALALVWATEHFHVFLYGKSFELVTDHKPLEFIFSPKSKPCARIERWILRIQSYKFKVTYQPGKNNIADSLSRLLKVPKILPPTQDAHIHQIVEYTRPVAVSLQEIRRCSSEDQEIQKVKDGVFFNKWDDEVKVYKIFQSELCFYEGILLRGTKIVVPRDLRDRVLQAAHEGHPGVVAMKGRLRTKVWWPKCDADAEKLVKSCKGCTLVSAPNPPNPLKRRELPEEPWVDIAMDLMGPLPSGDHLLVVVDYFSRYKEIKTCRQITSAVIVSYLKEMFSRLGFPSTITADNGKQFTSEEFKSFCNERNITLYNSIPYWPQQNGEVERQNRDILKRLKISQVEKRNWKETLQEYLIMYNSTPHSVTGKTPSELFFKRKFRDKIPMLSDATAGPSMEVVEVKDKDREMKEKGKEYADRKRKAKECDLEPGDKVFVKNMSRDNKLSLNYDTTSHTVESSKDGDVQVRNDETGKTIRRNVVHLKRIHGTWNVVNGHDAEENGETTNDIDMEND